MTWFGWQSAPNIRSDHSIDQRSLSGDLIEPATQKRDRDRIDANNYPDQTSDQFTVSNRINAWINIEMRRVFWSPVLFEFLVFLKEIQQISQVKLLFSFSFRYASNLQKNCFSKKYKVRILIGALIGIWSKNMTKDSIGYRSGIENLGKERDWSGTKKKVDRVQSSKVISNTLLYILYILCPIHVSDIIFYFTR